MIEQRQAGVVGPMKILENQEQRLFEGEARYEIAEAVEQVAARLLRRQIERRSKIGNHPSEPWQQARQLRSLVSQ